MSDEKETIIRRCKNRILASSLGRLFLDKKFLVYTGIGIFLSVFSVFILWLLIDIFKVGTVQSGIVVTATVFVLRYALLTLCKVV